MIVPKHYENLNVLHENTMPHRAYYMPASKDMGSLVHDREKSDRMELLNGNWKFQFYKSIYDLQEKFYEAGYDTKGFDEIPVPGIWQNYGYDSHQYTNVRYPIRHMYHRRILAERTYTSLNIRKIPKHQKHT